MVVAAALVVMATAGCGSGGTASGAKHSEVVRFSGPTANPPFGASPLSLRDYRGRPVDLAGYRGKAVLVTFIYTHCPDVCPLIVGNLRVALSRLGARAKELQIIAVSTDPRGDTPKTVGAFLKAHRMTSRMEYLLGSRSELARVWRQWGIVARPNKANPELVEHSAEIFGIGASGKVYTLYPSNFKPAWIAHDVPLLARS